MRLCRQRNACAFYPLHHTVPNDTQNCIYIRRMRQVQRKPFKKGFNTAVSRNVFMKVLSMLCCVYALNLTVLPFLGLFRFHRMHYEWRPLWTSSMKWLGHNSLVNNPFQYSILGKYVRFQQLNLKRIGEEKTKIRIWNNQMSGDEDGATYKKEYDLFRFSIDTFPRI